MLILYCTTETQIQRFNQTSWTMMLDNDADDNNQEVTLAIVTDKLIILKNH